MTEHPFDTLVRTLASQAPRRRVLGTVLATAVGAFAGATLRRRPPTAAAAAGGAASAGGAAPASFLYVQSATAGTLTALGAADRYALTLTGVSARTVYFANI